MGVWRDGVTPIKLPIKLITNWLNGSYLFILRKPDDLHFSAIKALFTADIKMFFDNTKYRHKQGLKCFELVHFQALPEGVENAFNLIGFIV